MTSLIYNTPSTRQWKQQLSVTRLKLQRIASDQISTATERHLPDEMITQVNAPRPACRQCARAIGSRRAS